MSETDNDPDTFVTVRPTDVWVCLRSGVWNLTNPQRDDNRIPSRTQRAIMRGLLQAGIEALDEIDAGDMPTARDGGS